MINVIVSIFVPRVGFGGHKLVGVFNVPAIYFLILAVVRLSREYYDENTLVFDSELIGNVMVKMKGGKAVGLDGITCEYLLFSHPLLPGILAK